MNAKEHLDSAVEAHVKTHQVVINASVLLVMNYPQINKAVKVCSKLTVTFSLYNYVYAYILDIDECSRTSGICSNGVCENMMGTYQCICDDGFRQTDQKFYCEGKHYFN